MEARGLYRSRYGEDWINVEILGRRYDAMLILREADRPLPGVFLATIDQVRVPVGLIEQPKILPRGYLPPMTPKQRWKYRTIREVSGRDEALRQVLAQT